MKKIIKNPDDFGILGTFEALNADILEPELEKVGITVKRLYPGTYIGTEATANASVERYTLWIMKKDFERAKKVCDKFNMKPV